MHEETFRDENEGTAFYPLHNREEETSRGFTSSSFSEHPAVETVTDGPWTTFRDHVALQFFWQGYDAYVVSKDKESVAPCLYNAQCIGESADREFVQLVPVDEVRERHILDKMRVQLVSVHSGKYLRASHVSKYLKWSRARDEQSVFFIQIADRKPLNSRSKFTLTSCFWPDHAVGFTQTFPLGGSRAVTKAIGFLTLEKKKKQMPLLFPIRFRAVLRSQRNNRALMTATVRQLTPFVTATDMLFIGEEDAERVSEVPLARVPSPRSMDLEGGDSRLSGRLSLGADQVRQTCTFCSVLFRARDDLVAHIRDCHGEMMHRVSIPGTFCIHCGTRRVDGRCTRCNQDA
ncbi:unnamed protein product [Peronospora farinosa]|uniref:C2H2-type domain-containing protein n=1 Tax=Peronospora farinosa TaxID=134698 RepID=A0ABN8BTI7_9STRA|nr:unnamed protein product [Peronospora farinosa]